MADHNGSNGRKTVTIANWKVYLGVMIIIVQLFAYGFLFIQDRNQAINRLEKVEETVKELKLQTQDMRTLKFNLKKFLADQGYKWIGE